ncbi:MAG: tyrosine-type recombinase/integrase [Christensenellaceae bacterium]|jgi:site-specific recombinase XerD|nr:tyrosine-type recombinase/integrase [Christensenellaceae bacterium]
MKYVEERNRKTLELLDKAKQHLPGFCNHFFVGVAQTTQPLSRLNYAYDLGVFFKFLSAEIGTFIGKKVSEYDVEDLEKIEIMDIELYAEWLTRNNSARGVMRNLSCLRSFFAFYFKKGEIGKNILPNVDLPRLHQKNIIRLEGDEVDKIIDGAKSGTDLTTGQKRFHKKNSFRDTTILTLFLSSGMRVSELVGLNVGDIDLKNSSFRVTRKGGNETVLYMTKELLKTMQEYLADNPASERPLFLNPENGRLGVRAVQNLVKKYAGHAAPLKNISPHKLRSTFGTNLYRATGDIYAVADCLGHQNVNTTKKHYAAITEEVRKNAIEQFESSQKT